MHDDNNLNILHAHTLRLVGISLDQLWPSTTPFHGVAQGNRIQPLEQIDLPVVGGVPEIPDEILEHKRKEYEHVQVHG
jgi:hypothetical protein